MREQTAGSHRGWSRAAAGATGELSGALGDLGTFLPYAVAALAGGMLLPGPLFAGFAAAYLTVALVYLGLWSLLYLSLPRATSDPGAALPGAAVVALTVTGMQAISVLYLPGQISGASTVYGVVGYFVVILGWFFIIGRVLAFSFAINAVIYETYGSISQVIFGLPVVRILPRRWPFFVDYFDLEDRTPTSSEE